MLILIYSKYYNTNNLNINIAINLSNDPKIIILIKIEFIHFTKYKNSFAI